MTMLKSLFEKVTRPSSSETPRITGQPLKEVYEAHKLSDHPRIRLRVWEDVQDKREIPGRDEEYFRRLLRQLLECEPVSPPDPGSTSLRVGRIISPDFRSGRINHRSGRIITPNSRSGHNHHTLK